MNPFALVRQTMARAAYRVGNLFATEGTPAPTDDFWYTNHAGGVSTQAGLSVTPQNALQVSTVFACVKVIAETLAMLPLIVYERTGENAKRRAVDEPTYDLLHKQPNAWQTPYDFKECLTGWAALHGNGYARKIMAPNGVTRALIPIHPSLVELELIAVDGRIRDRLYNPDMILSSLDDGDEIQLRYLVRQKDGTKRPFTQGEMLHIRGISLDAVGGVVVSRHAREAIALAQAMEAFGARYFANDLTLGTVLEHPGKLSEQAYERLKRHLDNRSGVAHAFRRFILEEGMKQSRSDAKANEAQLTEGRLHQVVEICRYYRMPPHKVQHLDKATFSNIEHQAIEFGTDTIQPWCVRWEQACSRDLILDDDRYFAEVLMHALMRGDSVARSNYYRERFNTGTLSRNEIRALENENPIEGGDNYYMNAATVMLDASGKPIPAPQVPNGAQRRAFAPVREEEDDDQSAVASSFAVLLSDAAARIERAEAAELQKRAKKRSDHERFAAWAEEFYAEHERYALRVLTPIARAWSALGHDEPDIATRAAEIAAAAKLAALNGASPPAVLPQLADAFTLRTLPHAA